MAAGQQPMICFSLNPLVVMSIILRFDGLHGNMAGTVYGGRSGVLPDLLEGVLVFKGRERAG
jgi:hypothetical protein